MDPGQGGATVPTQMRDQTVTVTKPQGTVTINNPLYKYTFGNTLPSEMGGGPWNNFPETLRRPVANPTRSNNNEMNAVSLLCSPARPTGVLLALPLSVSALT